MFTMHTVLEHASALDAAIHAIATVVADLGHGNFLLDLHGGTLTCKRAASCLLHPETGDKVLVSGPSRQQSYLIAVLERDSARTARIGVEGAMAIGYGGAVQVLSDDAISLESAALSLTSGQLGIRAESAVVVAQELSYQGRQWQGALGVLRHTGQALEMLLDKVRQVTRVCYRQVEQTDHLRAGQLDYQARDYLRLHGDHVMVTSDKLLKMDSKQIHLG
ncbi:DUF3540 domain-containing protein [Massilia sp. CCM 8695]|uniref:DUF3540 domain-containing protein n=2 Tax=Massilia frigida TaxID=2609281 RepID=A0ABX0NGQ7_9BURK|nr:DUF3540 domain-containing protein [Massilia frigida]